MVGVVRNWRAELVEAYPDLFHPSKFGVGDFCSCELRILDTHPSQDS
jgi:hypothetical protein